MSWQKIPFIFLQKFSFDYQNETAAIPAFLMPFLKQNQPAAEVKLFIKKNKPQNKTKAIKIKKTKSKKYHHTL